MEPRAGPSQDSEILFSALVARGGGVMNFEVQKPDIGATHTAVARGDAFASIMGSIANRVK